MDWYERWFGEEYLLVYQHRNVSEAESEIEAIRQLLEIGKGERVLDLCCGPGRHDFPLAYAGCRIIGLDYSMPLLKQAMEAHPRECSYPYYICGDARSVPFQDGIFDVILNLFTSFGYFKDDENRELVNTISRLLKPGGRFFIDYLNPLRLQDNLVEETKREIDGMEIIEKRRVDYLAKRIEKTILLQGEHHSQMFFESVRLYQKDEMLDMLTSAGLTVAAVLGDASGQPYNDDSSRMVFHGTKRETAQ
ncbi:class I SAM-dependent methyltransferase [Candidatus Latescibacterota bacterium]